MPAPLVTNPPKGLLRWVLRVPVVLYRLNLGWLLGKRFLLVNHIGRKSGQLRQTVVEVVAHDKASDTYYIVSGWGYKADWYQNLLATPAIAIQVVRRKLAMRAESVSPDVEAQVLLNYRREHPFAARELSRLLGIDIHKTGPAKLEEIVYELLPVVALHPQNTIKPQ